jgi:hopene-associated glycosyltransferase HpnB
MTTIPCRARSIGRWVSSPAAGRSHIGGHDAPRSTHAIAAAPGKLWRVTALRILTAVSLAGWFFLALVRGMYWRTDVRLPIASDPPVWPAVAIVVPARDEAAVLPHTLPTLTAQAYPGPVSVILVDDNSTDGTTELVGERWPQVVVVDPGEPAAGWAGKLWALRAGVMSAESAGVDITYFLFTDADIAHRPDSLAILVRAAEVHRLDVVSQMARLRVHTGWERLVVPAFVYFFALLYPFRWSNAPGARTAAAAGGCSLVRRTALESAGGLEAIRGAVIDDVALARAIKRSGGRTFLGLADRVDSIRPYRRLADLWRMVARSAYAQLHRSVVLLAGTVIGLGLMFWIPPVCVVVGAVTGDVPTLLLSAAAYALMSALFVPMLRYYRLTPALALALPFTATLYLGMTVDSAVQHYRGNGAAWKGRTYAAQP